MFQETSLFHSSSLARAFFFYFFPFFLFTSNHLELTRAGQSLSLCTRTPIKATSCSAITWLKKTLPSLYFFVGGVLLYLSSFELHCSLNMTCKCTVFLLPSLCTSCPVVSFRTQTEKERERPQTVTLLFLLFRPEKRRRSSSRGVCVCVIRAKWLGSS